MNRPPELFPAGRPLPVNPETVDIANLEGVCVGVGGRHYGFLNLRGPLSAERALVVAAYLIALADEDGAFARILERVQAT